MQMYATLFFKKISSQVVSQINIPWLKIRPRQRHLVDVFEVTLGSLLGKYLKCTFCTANCHGLTVINYTSKNRSFIRTQCLHISGSRFLTFSCPRKDVCKIWSHNSSIIGYLLYKMLVSGYTEPTCFVLKQQEKKLALKSNPTRVLPPRVWLGKLGFSFQLHRPPVK